MNEYMTNTNSAKASRATVDSNEVITSILTARTVRALKLILRRVAAAGDRRVNAAFIERWNELSDAPCPRLPPPAYSDDEWSRIQLVRAARRALEAVGSPAELDAALELVAACPPSCQLALAAEIKIARFEALATSDDEPNVAPSAPSEVN